MKLPASNPFPNNNHPPEEQGDEFRLENPENSNNDIITDPTQPPVGRDPPYFQNSYNN